MKIYGYVCIHCGPLCLIVYIKRGTKDARGAFKFINRKENWQRHGLKRKRKFDIAAIYIKFVIEDFEYALRTFKNLHIYDHHILKTILRKNGNINVGKMFIWIVLRPSYKAIFWHLRIKRTLMGLSYDCWTRNWWLLHINIIAKRCLFLLLWRHNVFLISAILKVLAIYMLM